MSDIGSVANHSAAGSASARAPADTSAELAKLEKQLSDCVNCASSETSEGKAKIAELADKIDAIKARAAQAEATQAEALKSEKTGGLVAATHNPVQGPSGASGPTLRFDGLGAYVNTTA